MFLYLHLLLISLQSYYTHSRLLFCEERFGSVALLFPSDCLFLSEILTTRVHFESNFV